MKIETHDYEVCTYDIEVLATLNPQLKWFTIDSSGNLNAWYKKPVRDSIGDCYHATEENEFDRLICVEDLRKRWAYFLDELFYEEEPVSREWLINTYKAKKFRDTDLLEMIGAYNEEELTYETPNEGIEFNKIDSEQPIDIGEVLEER